MDKIKNSFVIFATIIGFPNDEIDVKEFYSQVKKTYNYIKSLGYEVEKLDTSNIYLFFRTYTSIGKIVDNKVIINTKTSNKHKDFFFNGVDINLINSIKESNRFIFPMLLGDEVINYFFITSNQYLNEVKNKFYYDGVKNKSYIIDLTKIEDKKNYNEILSFLESFLIKDNSVEQEILNYKELGKLFNLSYSIRNQEYGSVIQQFGLNDEFNKIESIYETLFYYCTIANNNSLSLSEFDKNKILRK